MNMNRNLLETKLEIDILGLKYFTWTQHDPVLISWGLWTNQIHGTPISQPVYHMRNPLGLKNTGILVLNRFTVM